ncbi:MAG: hypothetical protein EAX95_06975 [Candidatus Thorarchaeota archaeon]|nr:hypothetical protein [Candidatus Thorarchaeota archaeon]
MSNVPPYWTSPLRDSFQVTAISCEQKGDRFEVAIEEDVVRPAGGGQAGDRGQIEWNHNSAQILDSALIEEKVVLITDKMVEPGTRARLHLDMQWRRASMRNHTAEHIFVASMKKIHSEVELGYIWIDGENGVVDLCGAILSFEDVVEAEKAVQDLIRGDYPVITELVPAANLPESVRAREGITKKHETMRIVKVGDYDESACSGIHVLNTGDIGAFKLVDLKQLERGIRVEFVTGAKAISMMVDTFNEILRRKHDYPYEIEQIGAVIDKARAISLERTAMLNKITELILEGRRVEQVNGINFIHHLLPGFGAKDMKHLLKQIKIEEPFAVMLSNTGEKPSLILWTGGLKKPAGDYISRIVEERGGRGGGSKEVYTGGFSDVEDLEGLFQGIISDLRESLGR